MERNTIHRSIQGGGTGSGFQLPRQILRHERVNFTEIARDIISMARTNSPSTTSTEVMKQDIWTAQLENRLFYLRQRRNEMEVHQVHQRIVTSNTSATLLQQPTESFLGTPIQPSTQNLGTLNNSGTLPHFHTGPTMTENALALRPAIQRENKRSNSFSKREVRTSISTRHLRVQVKYIPGIPKTIDSVIEIWRNGTQDSNYKPVRFFETAAMRKSLVLGYTHTSWSKGGQKSAYYRFKDIVFYLHKFCNLSIDVFEEGTGDEWSEAVEWFKDNSKIFESSMSMTSLLQKIRSSSKH